MNRQFGGNRSSSGGSQSDSSPKTLKPTLTQPSHLYTTTTGGGFSNFLSLEE
jgi:hypothetical protein